jgi:hypothetical protein
LEECVRRSRTKLANRTTPTIQSNSINTKELKGQKKLINGKSS